MTPPTLPDDVLELSVRELLALLTPADHPDRPVSFADIERATHAVGQHLARHLTTTLLHAPAGPADEFAACPRCHLRTRLTRHKRTVHTLDGPVEYHEPAAHGLACRRDFFPSPSATGPDRTAPESGAATPAR